MLPFNNRHKPLYRTESCCLYFQRFGQHKEVLSILCANSNAQARDVKFRLTLKALKVNPTWIMLNMRVVSENAPWFTSGSHTSLFPKFWGKLNKTQKCSSVSEEVFELQQKMGHCGSPDKAVFNQAVCFFNCCSGPDLQISVWWEQPYSVINLSCDDKIQRRYHKAFS